MESPEEQIKRALKKARREEKVGKTKWVKFKEATGINFTALILGVMVVQLFIEVLMQFRRTWTERIAEAIISFLLAAVLIAMMTAFERRMKEKKGEPVAKKRRNSKG